MCGVFFFLFKFLSNFCFGLNLEKKYFYIKVKFFNQSTPPSLSFIGCKNKID